MKVKTCDLDGRPCHPECEQWSDCRFAEDDLKNDIIESLRYQVTVQNEELNKYRVWIRKLLKAPHKWLRDEAREILG